MYFLEKLILGRVGVELLDDAQRLHDSVYKCEINNVTILSSGKMQPGVIVMPTKTMMIGFSADFRSSSATPSR